MRNFNKKHKPKHFSKPRWCWKNLYVVSLKERYNKFLKSVKGYCLIRNNSTKNKDKTFKPNIFKLSNLNIGKKFMFQNKRYKVIKSDDCNNCSFNGKNCFQLQNDSLIPECSEVLRRDENNVKFVACNKKI